MEEILKTKSQLNFRKREILEELDQLEKLSDEELSSIEESRIMKLSEEIEEINKQLGKIRTFEKAKSKIEESQKETIEEKDTETESEGQSPKESEGQSPKESEGQSPKESESSKEGPKITKSKETRDTIKYVRNNIDLLKSDQMSDAMKEDIKKRLSKRQKTPQDMKIIREGKERIQKLLKKMESEEEKKPSEPSPNDPKDLPENIPKIPEPAPGKKVEEIKARKVIIKRELPKLKFPSTTIILAKKFSGKTNLILNLIDKDSFDNIWVVSMTGFKGNLDQLCDDEDCKLENVSEEMLEELMKMHKESDMNSLIIFDDVIGQVNLNSKKMQKLATAGRNYGISILISSQDFYKTPPVWRRNSEYWFLGSMTDSNIQAVSKELSVPSMPSRRIRDELSQIARDKQHDWLFYDDRNTKFQKIFGNQLDVII